MVEDTKSHILKVQRLPGLAITFAINSTTQINLEIILNILLLDLFIKNKLLSLFYDTRNLDN